MSTVHLSNVSFAYSDSVSLIQELELRLDPAWYGVVGANGAGKTTLLRLVAGSLAPEKGAVVIQPAGAAAVYCPQEVDERMPDLATFAASPERLARRLLGQLALCPADLERWETLSPGERKRWQVGAALAADPLILLLDEPTNHLDAEARDLLLAALQGFRGIGLVVSHDRALLNALTSYTLRFHWGRIRCWRGGYDDARQSWEAEERERRGAWAELRGEQRKLERRLADRRQRKDEGLAKMRTIKRTSHPKDKAARRPFKFPRRRSKDASLSRDIQKTHHKLDRLSGELSGFRFQREIGRSLFVDYVPARTPELFALEVPEIRAGERVLLRDVRLSVARDSRVRVAGPNGIGKTTLLRSLLDSSRVPASRLLYLPQELSEEEEIALLDSVRALGGGERGRVLSIVAALGVAPEPLLASRRPSPGEARKLSLSCGLARQVWGLVLDEPTNHLDLPSIERIEAALASYPGALLVVTHDDAFASRLTTTCWELRDGRVTLGAPARARPREGTPWG